MEKPEPSFELSFEPYDEDRLEVSVSNWPEPLGLVPSTITEETKALLNEWYQIGYSTGYSDGQLDHKKGQW